MDGLKKSRKKVGILTFHQCHNVGAMLGAYALQKTVRKIGYEVEFINNTSPIYIEHGKKASHNLYRRGDEKGIYFRDYYREELEGRWNKFESFCREQLFLSQEIEKEDDIKRQLTKYGLILVGGDQLWNRNLEVAGDIYYIPYENDIHRIAFGTSMGDAADISSENIEWLKRFDYIGVREETAALYIESIVEREVRVVPDNIFLLDKREWENIAVLPKFENYMFVYLFCKNYKIFEAQLREIEQISKEIGKQVIVCATDVWEGADTLVPVIDMGPIEWLGFLLGADFVITNSFHGVAFSLALKKQFICLDSDCRKENLLKEFKLTDRLSKHPSDIRRLLEIDYQIINEQISKQRKEAILFLTKAIAKCYEEV